MKLNYFYVITISFFLFSCNSDDFNLDENTLESSEIDSNRIGLEVAIMKMKNSLNIIKSNSTENRTRSGQFQNSNNLKILKYEKKIYDIRDIYNEQVFSRTKSSLVGDKNKELVSVYLVEFENNGKKGFSIASDDYRIPHAIAITENGSLSDTVYNTGLAMYINSLDEVCKSQILRFNKKRSQEINTRISGAYHPVKPEILGHLEYKQYFGDDAMDEIIVDVTEGYVTCDINPLLKTKWSQREPYNNKSKGGKALAGCVPVATAQIMSFFKKPYTTAYWDELLQRPTVSVYDAVLSDRVSSLLAEVGKGVKVDYGADFKDAAPYLRSVGINCTFQDFMDDDIIIANLKSSKPVMLAGRKTEGVLGLYYTDGHAWIADGIYTFKFFSKTVVTQYILDDAGSGWVEWNEYEKSGWNDATYFHLNWGWGGYSDGYYNTANYSYETKDWYRYKKRMIIF